MNKQQILKSIALLLSISWASISIAVSQQKLSTTNKKAIAYFQEADSYLQQRKFVEGIAFLEKAVDKDSNFFEAHLRLGSAYRIMLNTAKAKQHIYKACRLRPAQKDMAGAYYMVSEYFFKEQNYTIAKEYASKTIAYTIQESLKSQARKVIADSDFAIAQLAIATNVNQKKMKTPLNQFYMQGFPVLTADGENLIFFKRNGTKITDSEDVMISKKTNEYWSVPESLSDSINSNYNEGMCSISGDGHTLVFASCKRPDGIEGSCDIYVSYKRGSDWCVPFNLGNNVNSKYWDSEPSISADGTTIYFSSDRKGGLGREDIWLTTKNDKGIWSAAKNVGAPVNSIGREVSPFVYASSKTLFFATDYLTGMGGFDIFYAPIKDSAKYGTPVNIGAPINTSIHDVSLFISADGQKGYFSRDELEEGLHTYTRAFLYEFDVPQKLKDILKKTIFFKGKVTDAETKAPIGAKVELLDLATGKATQQVYADEITGEYIIVLAEGSEYDLHVERENYLFHSQYVDFKNPNAFDSKETNIMLSPLKIGSSVVLNNVFFKTNDYLLDEKSKTELQKLSNLLTKNKTMKLVIIGHTDDQGKIIDNQILSEKRAKEVAHFLASFGIAATRLVTKGAGSTLPIATNATDDGRAQNRRIEIKVLVK